MLPLCGIRGGPMRGAFSGLNEEALQPLQRRLQLRRRRQLASRHPRERHQGIVQKRRELLQGFMGFGAGHPTLHGKSSTGGIRLVIIEPTLSCLRQGGQFAFGAPARLTPSRTGCDPCGIRVLLGCLGDVTEDGESMVELGLG